MEALQNCDAIESDPHGIPILAQPPFLSKLVLHLPTTICTPAAAPQVFFSPESQAESFRPHPDPSQEVFVRYGNIISLSWIQNQRLNSSYDVLFPLISLNLRRSHTLLKVNRWIGGSTYEHIAEAKQSLG